MSVSIFMRKIYGFIACLPSEYHQVHKGLHESYHFGMLCAALCVLGGSEIFGLRTSNKI